MVDLTMKADIVSDFQVHGLFAHHWRAAQNSLPVFHRHNEIELNFLARGKLVYTIAGRTIPLPLRKLSLFWAGFSHRISAWQPRSEIWALSLPLTTFLTWNLPGKNFVHPLLHGELLHESCSGLARVDLAAMHRWYDDLHTANTPHREALLLEIHARLLRMATAVGTAPAHTGSDIEPARVDKMLQYAAAHYRDPDLSIHAIARHAGTNATYAMELFKKTCGVSLMQYVNDQRVTHAQRLLVTTQSKILDIAMDAGFGSLSQFHDVFRRVTGKTPREYARLNGAN